MGVLSLCVSFLFFTCSPHHIVVSSSQFCVLHFNVCIQSTTHLQACQRNHVNIARALLQHDADVNVPSPDGTLPIHDAAANHSIDMVSLLMRFGAASNVSHSVQRFACTAM
jgi:ankyrin repeat protein